MEIPSDHYWSMMMDELVDLDEERLRALDVLIRQKERIAKIYNKKVKSKVFDVGDLARHRTAMSTSYCDVKILFNFITDPVHFISLGAKLHHRDAMAHIVLR
ncbi:hypothetical protein QL285_058904 [Trifolium repens]|nr:hypothetical protein QL285_058904 [Trifolium repens]